MFNKIKSIVKQKHKNKRNKMIQMKDKIIYGLKRKERAKDE